MKNITISIASVLTAACCAALLFSNSVSAQILQVSSVSVDSVWNSDSTWHDDNQILQQRTSRDCRISFTPQGEGKALMSITMSIDSGKTWEPLPNPLTVMNYAFDSTYSTGQKATITVRVLGGDRPGTVFKMTARQAAPVILGNPKIISRGLTETLAPGQSIDVVLDIRQNREALIGGFCTLSKVYWDALGDGTVNDSTTDTNVLSWTWLTQVPAGALGQKRSVIVKAVDKNGLWSAPETLSVRFGVIADSVVDIDGNVYHTVKIGTQEWTMENLRVTRYNDGTAIPKDTSHATWHATTPKYCFFKNTTNADSIKKFGALYNWYVVDLSNPQKIAPAGWHVPSDSEWTVMEKYLITNGYTWDGTTTNNTIAKALAGQTDWIESGRSGAVGNNMTANNSSGFSALGAGYRIEDGFDGAGYFGYWWSTTVDSAAGAYSRNLRNNGDDLNKFGGYESSGFSVRLVRD